MKTLIASLSALALAAAPAAAELTRIGAAAAVSGSVRAASAGAAARALKSGEPVFLNDRITTDGAGRLQVLLLDQTVFTVGPSSDMILDEFVYDPTTSAGKVSAKVTKGVFRFVTGKVARQDPGSMKVKLPVGTIGIRGTIAGGQVDGQGSTVVLLGPGAGNDAGENPGAIEVSNDAGGVVIDRPGFGTSVQPGLPPASPSDMSGFADQLADQLSPEGSGQGSGGQAPGGEGASASEESGEDTASGGSSAGSAEEVAQVSEELGTTSNQASQEIISGLADGPSSWDDLRGIPTGLGWYNANGTYTCSGGGFCSVGGSGSINFTLEVDFGARTYGGGTSQIGLSGGPLTDSVSISNTSFEALTGDAVITLSQSAGNLGSPSNLGNFDGSTIKFDNAAGQAAADATLDLNYVSSASDVADGVVTAPKGELPPQ